MCGCWEVEVNGLGSWANSAIRGQWRRYWKNTYPWVHSLVSRAEPLCEAVEEMWREGAQGVVLQIRQLRKQADLRSEVDGTDP